jgi:hypothetical protein
MAPGDTPLSMVIVKVGHWSELSVSETLLQHIAAAAYELSHA